MALSEEEKDINRCRIILGTDESVHQKAEYWKNQENDEKYLTDALLTWENYTIIDPKERELIEKGARLREKFLQECVKYSKK